MLACVSALCDWYTERSGKGIGFSATGVMGGLTTMWVLRIEAKSSATAAGALTTVLWAYFLSFFFFLNPVFVQSIILSQKPEK